MTRIIPKKISKQLLMAYWQKHATDVFPWLKDRPVTLEQVFDTKIIYRRYTDKEHTTLITINSEQDIITWAYRHTYSFHPYICSRRQKAPCWYVLDIDTKNVMFRKMKQFTYWVVNEIKQQFDTPFIAFCGNNGFHVFLELPYKDQNKVFEFSKRLTFDIATIFYTKNIYKQMKLDVQLTSAEEQKQLESITQKYKVTNVNKIASTNKITNKTTSKTIFLDTRILHRFANIRSPWSIHPKTGLVSLPIKIDQILTFKRQMATINKLI